MRRLLDGVCSARHKTLTNDLDDDFIEYLKSLSPSTADLELRSLTSGDPEAEEESNELLHFVRALTSRLMARRDYELTQAWMTVFLRLHFDKILEADLLREALVEWKKNQTQECDRLDTLVGYCGGVVTFLRSPRA
jgi:U3 small nucleolar RNA-associated protein 21